MEKTISELLSTPPILSKEQEEVLLRGFGAILPPTEIYKVGWTAALGYVRRQIETIPSPPGI